MSDGLNIRIASDDVRLGRHINHDPRSRLYALDTEGLDALSVEWALRITSLNQGSVGKCTAESACEVLGSDPFFVTLTTEVQQALGDNWTNGFYSDEEQLDGDGPFPPNDNGSSGLTSAKVALERGLIAGYQHTFTALDALKGLQLYPACWGTLWKTGMDDVDDTGQVRYSGATRGGHELSLYKVDAVREQLWFHNHWGAWGYRNSGVAWISFEDFEASLREQGDVTFYTPLGQPNPQPTPAPPTGDALKNFLATPGLTDWAKGRHSGMNETVAKGVQKLLAGRN